MGDKEFAMKGLLAIFAGGLGAAVLCFIIFFYCVKIKPFMERKCQKRKKKIG